jgi:hypothetical protein
LLVVGMLSLVLLLLGQLQVLQLARDLLNSKVHQRACLPAVAPAPPLALLLLLLQLLLHPLHLQHLFQQGHSLLLQQLHSDHAELRVPYGQGDWIGGVATVQQTKAAMKMS